MLCSVWYCTLHWQFICLDNIRERKISSFYLHNSTRFMHCMPSCIASNHTASQFTLRLQTSKGEEESEVSKGTTPTKRQKVVCSFANTLADWLTRSEYNNEDRHREKWLLPQHHHFEVNQLFFLVFLVLCFLCFVYVFYLPSYNIIIIVVVMPSSLRRKPSVWRSE